MKSITLFCLSLLLTVAVFSQTPRMTWSEEIKLKRGSFDQEVIQADNTGVFLKESRSAYRSFIIANSSNRESATLIRLDKNLIEVYRSNYNDDLKGKQYEQFFFLKSKLFLLASEYDKKDMSVKLFAAEINKADGKRSGDFKQITGWNKLQKNEIIDFRPTYNADSSRMVLVSTIKGTQKVGYEISQFDDALNKVNNATSLYNEFEREMFQLEDLIYTKTGNIVVVGREYEYQEGKKKKSKYLDFKNYNIHIYDSTGKPVKEINTAIKGKWLISSKVKQMQNNELMLAAFYSNQKRGAETNGILVQRINQQTGNIVSTNGKAINTALITAAVDDDQNSDDKESKKKKAEEPAKPDEDGFSRYMTFRDFIYTPDGGIVIIAEEYNTYRHITSSYRGPTNGTGAGTWRDYISQIFECGNIMMCRIDANGNINWLHVLPKRQIETHDINSGVYSASEGGVSRGFFIFGNPLPYLAGVGLFQTDNMVHMVFNDHKLNAEVLQLGQKMRIARFGTRPMDCYVVSLNTTDGVYKRKYLFANEDVPWVMPRLGSVFGQEFYMLGRRSRTFGSTNLVVGRLSVK